MKLIINADDFGFSKSINNGIIDAYKEGLISSTTIMINMPYTCDAISKWKENSLLGIGLHINLTQGSPISDDVKSLVDENNAFHKHRKIENQEILLGNSKIVEKYNIKNEHTKDEKNLAERVLRGEYYYPATHALWFYAPAKNTSCQSTWYGQKLAGSYRNHCFYRPPAGLCPELY